MQGTYWRKRIQRKLTNKEDASIVNSDAELDLKIGERIYINCHQQIS